MINGCVLLHHNSCSLLHISFVKSEYDSIDVVRCLTLLFSYTNSNCFSRLTVTIPQTIHKNIINSEKMRQQIIIYCILEMYEIWLNVHFMYLLFKLKRNDRLRIFAGYFMGKLYRIKWTNYTRHQNFVLPK